MTSPVPQAPGASAPARTPFWRVLQLAAGVMLFLYSLRLLTPLPLERLPFVTLAAVLGAGSMSLADSVCGVLTSVVAHFQKGPRS